MIKLTVQIQCPEKPFVAVLIISGSISLNHSHATLSFLQDTGHFIVPF